MAYEEVYIEFWSNLRKKERIEIQDKMNKLNTKKTKEQKTKNKR